MSTADDLLQDVTQVVRDADEDFKSVGGSSRHWVRDCFLPRLEAAGLSVTRTHDQGTDGGYSLQYCTMCGQPKPLLALGQQWDQWEGVRICQQCHDGYREDMGDEAPALSAQPPAPSGEALREAAQGFVDALLEEGYDGNRKRLHGELMKLTSQLAQPSETP
jgi:hypothetical protein